ncbi:signal transduction histidine kinase [Ilyonectria sp. MPI-CAGE-AT-0026]|nr:signal transduction histidine kinase [Ilyonectria sp. MPI-CAGE-AT-0026]
MRPDENKLGPIRAAGHAINVDTFAQILQMDDTPEHEFSGAIVFDFLAQTEQSFQSLNRYLEESDLHSLASLGSFMKGSGEMLGLMKFQESCKQLERYGNQLDDDDVSKLDEEFCLDQIRELSGRLKTDFAEVEGPLRAYYSQFRWQGDH